MAKRSAKTWQKTTCYSTNIEFKAHKIGICYSTPQKQPAAKYAVLKLLCVPWLLNSSFNMLLSFFMPKLAKTAKRSAKKR